MIGKAFGSVTTFLREVRQELKKTSFPTRSATMRNTIIVIVFSLAVALFLGSLDMLFNYLLNTFVLSV